MEQQPDPNAAPSPAPYGDSPAMGGYPEPGEGNFKRGRWIAPVVGIALLGGAAGVGYFVFKKDKEAMKPEQAAKIKEDIFLLPRKEQLPEGRKTASSNDPLIE